MATLIDRMEFKDFEMSLSGLQRVVYILVNYDYSIEEICSMLSINKRQYHRIWHRIEAHWLRYFK